MLIYVWQYKKIAKLQGEGKTQKGTLMTQQNEKHNLDLWSSGYSIILDGWVLAVFCVTGMSEGERSQLTYTPSAGGRADLPNKTPWKVQLACVVGILHKYEYCFCITNYKLYSSSFN